MVRNQLFPQKPPGSRLVFWSRHVDSAVPSCVAPPIFCSRSESGAYSQAHLPPAFRGGTVRSVCGFNSQCATNDIRYAVSWSRHVWTPYRVLTSTVWVHPDREVARAGRGGVVLELSILRADVLLSFPGVTLSCFDSFSSFLLSLKPWLFVQTFFVLCYACAPTDTRSYLTTSACVLLFLWRCRFFRVFLYHYRFLVVWRVRRTFSLSGWYFSTL